MTATFHLAGDAIPADARVQAFESREGLNEPYDAKVELLTADASFRGDQALRTSALLTLEAAGGVRRHVHGVVHGVRFLGTTGTHVVFELGLRPAMAALAHREGCRIFQDLSVVDIVKEVLADAGVDGSVQWRLAQTYGPRDYVVQYRETELNFVQRLLEDEGIFFFFTHSPEGHTLVFADHAGAFEEATGVPPVTFGLTQGLGVDHQPLDSFERERQLMPTQVRLRDYDFTKPQVKPEGATGVDGAWPLAHDAHAAGFTEAADGTRRANARMRQLRADADVCRGTSRAIGLVPGVPFTVEGAAEPCNNGSFVVTSLSTTGTQTGGDGGGDANVLCDNRFEAVPAETPYAPPRKAHRPRIRGVQTAVVTGPSDEQQAIHVDEYGRVKVRFRWDRAGVQDDTSSCWLRCSQLGVGGAMILPRVGWEIAVAFEHGDPDRPFVQARIYNGKHKPPVSLPGAAASGGLSSFSSPGAAKKNAFTADDSGGSQGFGMSAAKDMNTHVGADKTETVAVDEAISVTANFDDSVTGSETVSIGANQEVNVGNALQIKAASQSYSIGGNEVVGAQANYVESVGGARSYSIGGNRLTISNGVRTLVDGAFSRDVGAVQINASLASQNDGHAGPYAETVGAVKVELVGGASVEEVSDTKTLTSSAAELHVVPEYSTSAAEVSRTVGGVHARKVGGNYEVSAPQIILIGAVGHFKGGGSSLKLNGGPITISGPKVTGKGAANVRIIAGSLKLS